MGILSALQPEKVFGLFETLSSVPHGSGNTKGVSDLCVGIARDAGFAQKSVASIRYFFKKGGFYGR